MNVPHDANSIIKPFTKFFSPFKYYLTLSYQTKLNDTSFYMKYDNATPEGRRKLLIIGLLNWTKIKIQQQTLFTTKTRTKSTIKYNNQIYNNKNH